MSDIQSKIETLLSEVNQASLTTAETVEQFRIRFLGSKNCLKPLFATLKDIPKEDKNKVGQEINQLKNSAQKKFDQAKEALSGQTEEKDHVDFSRPGEPQKLGARHPISVVRNEIISIFERIGYGVSEGPEVEDDWHNFSALNFPPEHPARDMQDTFFVEQGEKEMALRTHTSSVQVRVM